MRLALAYRSSMVLFAAVELDLFSAVAKKHNTVDALEQAERDRTVYLWWQLRLLHNGTFEAIRHHPRFAALVERIRAEMRRQRAELIRSSALPETVTKSTAHSSTRYDISHANP